MLPWIGHLSGNRLTSVLPICSRHPCIHRVHACVHRVWYLSTVRNREGGGRGRGGYQSFHESGQNCIILYGNHYHFSNILCISSCQPFIGQLLVTYESSYQTVTGQVYQVYQSACHPSSISQLLATYKSTIGRLSASFQPILLPHFSHLENTDQPVISQLSATVVTSQL